MPRTFLGIGTKFYGQEETKQPNVHIATRWFVLVYIPIFPIGSFQRRAVKDSNNETLTTSQHFVLSKAPLQKRHICNVYAFMLAMLILSYLGWRTTNRNPLLQTAATPSEQTTTPKTSAALATPTDLISNKKSYQRPTTDSNGVPFPEATGYLQGYEHKFWGNSSVTIDLSEKDYDIHLKIYRVDVTPEQTASVAFIKAHDTFLMSNLAAGKYDLRYRNLDTGQLFRTDPFELTEDFVDGDRPYYTYTALTVIFKEVIGGNMDHYPISEEDF